MKFGAAIIYKVVTLNLFFSIEQSNISFEHPLSHPAPWMKETEWVIALLGVSAIQASVEGCADSLVSCSLCFLSHLRFWSVFLSYLGRKIAFRG